jgi:TRAP transporter TAXI family solute receptor
MKRRHATWLCAATSAFACGGGQAPRRLSIATGGTGGVYYVLGGAYARSVERRLEGVEATAEVTAASVENLERVARGEADVAFTLADAAADAVAGHGRFGQPLPIRALAALYPNFTHLVALDGGPVASLADLRGRRVSLGAPNSGTEVIAERTLVAAGLDPARDVTGERLSVAESADALRDGRIDAFFWSGGAGTAAIRELASGPGARLRLVETASTVAALRSAHGDHYAEGLLPAAAYGLAADTPCSIVPNLLVVAESLDEALAFDLTRVLFEAAAELQAAHPEARGIELGPATASTAVPYHPGAVRYYRERNAWSR